MSGRATFEPFRIPRGALPEEAAGLAAAAAAEPLLVRDGDRLPAALAAGALVEIPAGLAGAADEACRGADGSPAGAPGPARACLNSEAHRARVEAAVRRALDGGHAGVCLDLPDAPLALGALGAGFCSECQRAFAKELARDYGDHFQPLDYLALAREALASSPGALGLERIPFGREFWRARAEWLDRAVGAYVRAARDAARDAARPFEVAARFQALGPAQFHAARHLDAALFPFADGAGSSGAGLFRLLRAVAGRRPCAVEPAAGDGLDRLAAVAAAAGVGLALPGNAPPPGGVVAVRRFAQAAAARGRSAARTDPVAECAVLYSSESDLWSGGDHRAAVVRAGDALAGLQVQAPVVMHPADAASAAVLVLAGARALSPLEAQAVRRRLETGGGVLCLGEPGAVDEAGRPVPLPFPAGKPAGLKVDRGTVVQIPVPPAPRAGPAEPREAEELARALQLLLGRGRRAASTGGRSPLHVVLYRDGTRLDAHLATLGPGPAQGSTLFVGLLSAADHRRGRFKSSAGADERIPMNPAGFAISTVLPAFEGYAVLSLPG